MNDAPQIVNNGQEEDAFARLREHDLMKLFDELTFRQKWGRVFAGLKQPKESGENKWARLQMTRLLSPVMAVIVPFLMLGLITLFSKFGPESVRTYHVKSVDPVPIEKLEDIVEPEFVPPEPLAPIDVQVVFSMVDATATPTDKAAPLAEMASVQPTDIASVAIIKSVVIMPGMFVSRSPGAQGVALSQFSGGHTAESVLRSLRWLAKNQSRDGSWGVTKPAMTALAILAYLAHGDTPASEEFGDTVEAGLRFLTDSQLPDGRFKGRDGHDYTQPIVAYALAEAAGMTRVPKIKEAAIKAVQVIVQGQNSSGSFDYGIKPSVRDDLSVAGWCIQSMKAARIAGLDKDVPGLEEAMQKAVDGCRAHYNSNGSLAGFGYSGPGQSGLSGVGVLCMQFLGEAKSKEVRTALMGLNRWDFNWEKPPAGSVLYYWYYITQAYFQEGGKMWDEWNKKFSYGLIKVQEIVKKDASGYVDHKDQPQEIGSWTSPAASEANGGNKVMDTILCTLMLEVYYRYLPTFQQIPADEIQKETKDDKDIQIEIVDHHRLLQV